MTLCESGVVGQHELIHTFLSGHVEAGPVAHHDKRFRHAKIVWVGEFTLQLASRFISKILQDSFRIGQPLQSVKRSSFRVVVVIPI